MAELLGPGATPTAIGVWGGWALGITLVGWSAGGLLFGMVADRWGRTRTMALTILIYSLFTGLTGLAQTPAQLLVLRFIAALGIGGEWGAGASMIAEVFPKTSRAVAAGILQSASGTGFFAAILLEYLVGGNWRYAFFGGALPAALALVVRLGLQEPEAWVQAKARASGARRPRRVSRRRLRRARAAPAPPARNLARHCRHLRLLGDELLGQRALYRAAEGPGRRTGSARVRGAPSADRAQHRQHGRIPVVHPAHHGARAVVSRSRSSTSERSSRCRSRISSRRPTRSASCSSSSRGSSRAGSTAATRSIFRSCFRRAYVQPAPASATTSGVWSRRPARSSWAG